MFVAKEKVKMKRSLLTAIMLLAVGVAFADNMYKEGTIVTNVAPQIYKWGVYTK